MRLPTRLALAATLSCQVPPSGMTTAQVAEVSQPQHVLIKTIQEELAAAGVPGGAIAVVVGDNTTVAVHGVADIERGTRVTASTLFPAGSLGKLLTAWAVTKTLEERGISLDTDVGRHLPGLRPRVGVLTFHQLLSQTAGLRDRPGDDGNDDESQLVAAARALDDRDLVLPAGTVFSYSNLGYALAGAAAQEVAKKPFADLLRDAVLTPLGMSDAAMRPSEVRTREHASGHRVEGSKPVPVRTFANDTRLWPAGYVWTSAADMSRMLTALMQSGRVPLGPGLRASVIERSTAPHTPMPNVFVGGHYGYGLMIARDRDTLVYEHGGTMPGFSAIVRVIPSHKIGVAILTNVDSAPLRRIAQSVMARAVRLPDTKAAAPAEEAATVAEMRPLLGLYRNRGTAELAERDGRVVLSLDGGPPFAVSRIGDRRYLARPKPDIAGPEFVLQPATANVPAYLHFALWAYVKE
jgi:CubicO group peptidase (beta-lactamase class C family)